MKSNLKNITLCAIFTALLIVSKEALAFLPNIEIVTLLLMVYSYLFPFPYLLASVAVFCAVEGVIYGINVYFFGYLIVWPLLVLIMIIVRKTGTENEVILAFVAGAYGLLFDIPFAAVNMVMFGFNYAISYILSGTVFSVIHAVSNFIIVLLLLKPLLKFLRKQKIFAE